jgi:hypothetical protein
MKIQTDGFVAVGDLPNDEGNPCLVCRCVPDRVWQDLFLVAPEDVPASVAAVVPDSKSLAVTYRLCPGHSKVAPWRIRLLILERLSGAK